MNFKYVFFWGAAVIAIKHAYIHTYAHSTCTITVTITGRFVCNDKEIYKIECMTADTAFRSGKGFWEVSVIKKIYKIQCFGE